MSKSETLHNPFKEKFPFKVQMLIERPKNKGTITPEEAAQLNGELTIARYGDAATGMEIVWYWVYDPDQERVVSARYTLFGPPVLLAAADMAALLCRNKRYDEIEKINYKSLEYFLRDNPVDPAFPEEYRFAVPFVLRSLRAAIARSRGESLPESPTVCECAGVDEATIVQAIRDFDLRSVEAIGHYTRAGTFCGSCVAPGNGPEVRARYLRDILEETRKEMEAQSSAAAKVPEKSFKEMTLEEKRAAIEATIDEYIRSMLVMDGGDMEILDIKENGPNTDVYIRYLGACSGCASANTGTLFAIEGILKQKLDPNIRVLPL